MPINLETPKKFQQLVDQAHMVATEIFRKNSRKYDLAEHEYPKELDMLAAVIEGSGQGGGVGGAGAGTVGSSSGSSNGSEKARSEDGGNRNGSNMATLLGLTELCWGDVGLLLTMPRQGLGQAAIAAVANEEQLMSRILTPATIAEAPVTAQPTLEAVAAHSGWEIVGIYEAAGISGAKGRDMRPGFD